MRTHVLLLRGINLGPSTQLAMSDLADLVTGLGYSDVRTHLRSGNVVLSSGDSAEEISSRVEAEIANGLGMEVRVIVRDRAELAAVIANNPMPQEAAANPARYLVTFLSGTPDTTRLDALDPDAFLPDRFVVRGREIYQWCPKGVSKSKLTQGFWDKQRLGVAATARNWNTVTALQRLLDS